MRGWSRHVFRVVGGGVHGFIGGGQGVLGEGGVCPAADREAFAAIGREGFEVPAFGDRDGAGLLADDDDDGVGFLRRPTAARCRVPRCGSRTDWCDRGNSQPAAAMRPPRMTTPMSCSGDPGQKIVVRRSLVNSASRATPPSAKATEAGVAFDGDDGPDAIAAEGRRRPGRFGPRRPRPRAAGKTEGAGSRRRASGSAAVPAGTG